MDQAGLNKITFYENDGFSITFNASGEVTAMSTTGDTIELEYCDNMPKLKMNVTPGNNNILLYDYSLNANINDLTTANFQEIQDLLNNTSGWIPKFDFNNGKSKVVNQCFKASNIDELDNNVSNTFKTFLKTPIKTRTRIVNFV